MLRLMLVGLLALGACKAKDTTEEDRAAAEAEAQKVQDVLGKRAAPARALIKRALATRPLLASVPRAAPGTAPPVTEPKIVLSETRLDDPSGNADVLIEDELAKFNRGMLGTCNYNLTNRRADTTAAHLEDVFARGLRTKYFLVVRPDEHSRPKMDLGNHEYSGGRLEGDVVVFDISVDPPKPLGAFAVTADLVRTVEVRQDTRSEMIQHELDEALRATALAEIDKRLH